MTDYERRGTREKREIVSAEEFLDALIGPYERVHLEDCIIQGEVNIYKERAIRVEGRKYPIDKEIYCWNCIFTNDVYFGDIDFQKEADFRGTTFEQIAYFGRAIFHADADFTVATFQEGAIFSEATFDKGTFNQAKFDRTTFQGFANFSVATFQGYADFSSATFQGPATFRLATFQRSAEFHAATFQGDTDFNITQFILGVDFSGAISTRPVGFARVRYWPNTFGQWWRRKFFNDWFGRRLWRTIGEQEEPRRLARLFFPQSREREEQRRMPWMYLPEGKYPDGRPGKATEFLLNSELIDDVTNPQFKRYVADSQFIRALNGEHRFWARTWLVSSDYGRSFILWGFWSVLFALLFAVGYTYVPGVDFKEPLDFLSALYFSIVTFTTLGFGDIVAVNAVARVLVTVEVVLGYVMLGGLIAIFANKVARRS